LKFGGFGSHRVLDLILAQCQLRKTNISRASRVPRDSKIISRVVKRFKKEN